MACEFARAAVRSKDAQKQLARTSSRKLERVFRCYIVYETMEDYKEGCLLVWANYMSPCNSIVGLYFKGTCDVISVTMATHKASKFQFL